MALIGAYSAFASLRRAMLKRILQIVRTLVAFLHPYRFLAAASVALSLCAALSEGVAVGCFTLLARVLTGVSTSEALGGISNFDANLAERLFALSREKLALLLIAGVAAAQIGRAFLQFCSKAMAVSVQAKVESSARRSIFNRFMRLSFSSVRAYRTGEMTSLVEHVMYVGLVVSRLSTVLSQVALMLIYLLILAWLSLPMTLAVSGAALLVIMTMPILVRRIRRQGKKFTRASVSLSEEMLEFLHGIRLVKTYAREDFAEKRVSGIIDRSTGALRRGLLLQAMVAPAMDLVTVLGIAGFLTFGIVRIGRLDGPELAHLLTFVFVLYRFLPRIRIVNDQLGMVIGYLPFLERIKSFLESEDEEFHGFGGRSAPTYRSEIRFENVCYRYPGAATESVRNLSFTLPHGTTLALVGPSGGGKSTVVDLMIGLIQPTSGRILNDGIPLQEIDWMAWRGGLGVVSQDTFVFSASVSDNIAFGQLDASNEAIESAARKAGAHEFVESMEQGYATRVGNQGTRLSGGQRQRLGIARALVREPRLMILDEATSNLDSGSERTIQEAVHRVSRNRTTVTVAHRLSTIVQAQLILVLDGGEICESGTHARLLDQNGRYAELWRLQSTPSSD